MSFCNLTRSRYWAQERRCIWCGELTWCQSVIKKRDAAREFGITMGVRNAGKSVRHRMATAEHIIPASLGGKDGASNIAMACQLCNSRRASDASAFKPHPDVIRLLPKSVRKALSKAASHGGSPHD